MASFLFLGGWRAHVPGLSPERQGSLTCPWPYSLLPAPPHNHLFSYFHQQPNYWSFKVSVWCFCVRDNRMCSPAPAPPCTCFAQSCASARDCLVWVVGVGLQAGSAALREPGFACQGLVDPVWEFVPPVLGIWAGDAQASPGRKEHLGMREAFSPAWRDCWLQGTEVDPVILLRALFSELRLHLPGRPRDYNGPLIPFLLSTVGKLVSARQETHKLTPPNPLPKWRAGLRDGVFLPPLESLDHPQLERCLSPPGASC